MDEGGDPAAPGVGAHDAMWFAARDLVFGKDAYPLPTPPEGIGRPVDAREMPLIPPQYEQVFKLLMDVLMIEVRAESAFILHCRLFRDPEIFKARRAQAEHAAVLVERIQTDEAIHVAYLQAVVSELRSFTFKTEAGRVSGAEIIDPVWGKMVEWHGNLQLEAGRERSRAELQRLVLAERGEAGRDLLARIDALDRAQAARAA